VIGWFILNGISTQKIGYHGHGNLDSKDLWFEYQSRQLDFSVFLFFYLPTPPPPFGPYGQANYPSSPSLDHTQNKRVCKLHKLPVPKIKWGVL
jgi:hypothetical protein